MISSSNSSLREATLAHGTNTQILVDLIVATYKNYAELTYKLHPFVHRCLDIESDKFSFNPLWILDNVKNYGMHDYMFAGFASAAGEFVKTHRGLKRLPTVNIKTHRSFQLTDQFFRIEKIQLDEYKKQFPKQNTGNVRSVHKLVIEHLGATLFIENLLHEKYAHIIVRPKYIRGDVDLNRWEVILYPQKTDYMIEYLD